MTIGIMLIAAAVFLGVFCYRRPAFERRIFKNIPLIDWINVILLPLIIYIAFVIIVKAILSRPRTEYLDFTDFELLAVNVVFLMYAYVGNTIHFVGKVLSRYIPVDPHNVIYKVNEMFHDKLSHYLSFICCITTLSGIATLEINYPATIKSSTYQYNLILLSGLFTGILTAKAVLVWLHRNSRAITILCLMLLGWQTSILTIIPQKISYYPFNNFIFWFYLGIITVFTLRTSITR